MIITVDAVVDMDRDGAANATSGFPTQMIESSMITAINIRIAFFIFIPLALFYGGFTNNMAVDSNDIQHIDSVLFTIGICCLQVYIL